MKNGKLKKINFNVLSPINKILFYILLGVSWIFFTDRLLLFLTNNLQILTFFQTIKGTLYVLLTAIGLYFIIYFYNKELIKMNYKLIKKTRILNLISKCNQILVRDIDEERFLYEICELLVKEGGYKLVWIGMKEYDEKKSVKPIACYGIDEWYLSKVNISWDENSEYGRGPVGTANRTGKTSIFQDIEKDMNFELWLKETLKRGFRSVVACPIIYKNEILGSLNLYSDKKDFFDEKEIKLLEELALDVGYGIIERRKYNENKILLEKIQEDNIKLKEVDRLKNNFLSIISHELRTPLTPIKGFVEILMNNIKDETQKDYLNTIKGNVSRLQLLINDLVDISKIERGIIAITKTESDIVFVVKNVIKDLQFIAQTKNLKIEFKSDYEKLFLNIDTERIGQVLINLINNAIKFSNNNSKIIINLCKRSRGEINAPEYIKIENGEYVVIGVKDFGVGLDKKDLQKIFDKFYQVEDALIRKTSGLGLGLSISKYIIEAHNGHIWAESEGLNKGSIFYFLLPAN